MFASLCGAQIWLPDTNKNMLFFYSDDIKTKNYLLLLLYCKQSTKNEVKQNLNKNLVLSNELIKVELPP